MVAALLDAGGLDPTVINGGIINAYGTNARMGDGDWMVVEADESDGTFLKLPADIAVVTNIDPEHLDHYGDFDQVREAFRQFVENVPFYGFAVMCIDHPEVQALIGRIEDRRIITYGANPQADVRCVDLAVDGRGSRVRRAHPRPQERPDASDREPRRLPMPGEHNVQNATGADRGRARSRHLGRGIAKGLAGFGGVKRRFTHTGTWNGVDIFDDYGHHPVEIAAVLKAARWSHPGRVIAVAQPHRFTRLRDLFDRVLRLLQRCRHGDRRPGLSGRRGADRGRQPRRAGRGPPRRRPSRRARHRRARSDAAGDDRANRPRPATSSSASAPATSRNGPMRCRSNWRSSVGE